MPAGVPPTPPEDPPPADRGEADHARARSGDRPDVRQAVTDRILTMLAQGGHVFRARWVAAASRGVPRNRRTGQAYRGVNVLLLWDAAIAGGYVRNVWLTYRQACALGAQVRKGEHGVMCAHFERVARDAVRGARAAGGAIEGGPDVGDGDGGEGADARAGFVLRCRPFWLFNVAQVDGLPEGVAEAMANGAPGATDEAGGASAEPANAVEKALRLAAGCGAVVRHGFSGAVYLPGLDEVRLPLPRQFVNGENYCATLLHELVHWTGHPQRLSRAFGQRFGDAAYAFEELVAELGSAFLMGHCGLVDATIEGHAAYLQAWLAVLRRDRTAIFTAARLASEAFDFLVARQLPPLGTLQRP